MTIKELIVQHAMKADSDFIHLVVSDTFRSVDELQKSKSAEYSKDTNRFENFLDTAASEGIVPEQALWNMMVKHHTSIRKFVKEIGEVEYPVEKWNEKLLDEITYLILLRAMIIKRAELEESYKAKTQKVEPQEEPKKETKEESRPAEME